MGLVNLVQFDPVNQMIPLSVILLSGTHCNVKSVIMIFGKKQLFDLDCSETTFYQLKTTFDVLPLKNNYESKNSIQNWQQSHLFKEQTA